jgi:hypothetical protein
MNVRRDASDASRARRRITVACLIVCLILTALTVALMAAGHSSQWTVILFTVEASGVVATSHALLSMRQSGRPSAAARYATAVRALCEWSIENYAAGRCDEPPSELNDAVLEAERHCPFWRQTFIDRRIVRELDYWNRTGQ